MASGKGAWWDSRDWSGVGVEQVRRKIEEEPRWVRGKNAYGWLPLHLAAGNKASSEVVLEGWPC